MEFEQRLLIQLLNSERTPSQEAKFTGYKHKALLIHILHVIHELLRKSNHFRANLSPHL